MINYGKHFIDKQDIKSVVSVLKSNFLTQGPKVEEFQQALKKNLARNMRYAHQVELLHFISAD